ncbi:MAG: right-handed parallel beta-helix repeat-containing protein [Verrucomicrobia bacterium]|nr:right-handed parallel beta-helix repeat-containing protein [Verrucomicrobiota bacterium]
MKCNVSKIMYRAVYLAALSTFSFGSVSAAAAVNQRNVKNVNPALLKDPVDHFQAYIGQLKNQEDIRFLNSIHKAVSTVLKSSKQTEQFLDVFSLLDKALEKYSSTSAANSATTCRHLSGLKRYVAKAYANLSHVRQSSGSHSQKCHQLSCAQDTPIDMVPVTLTKPGKYCVTKELVYRGSGDAITIAASNVTINFKNHDLSLRNPAATGIFAGNVSEITILNDKIALVTGPATDTSAAILFDTVTKGRIDNVFTENTFIGVHIMGSNDVALKNSHHKDHTSSFSSSSLTPTAVRVFNSTAVAIDGIAVEGNSGIVNPYSTTGIEFNGGCRGCSLTNSKIIESDGPLLAFEIDGLQIENCLFSNSAGSSPIGASTIQLGNSDGPANDINIANSSFINEFGGPNVIGLWLLSGSGCTIDNCIVDTITSEGGSAAVYVGFINASTYSNAVIRNSTVQNQNDFGILLDHASNFIVENCKIIDSQVANIKLNDATQCTISNCVSSGSEGYGIQLTNLASTNAILANVVNANRNGISIASDALNNHLQDNKVFDNSGNGIDNGDPSTELYGNTSCNNGGANCSPSSSLFQQQSPGDSPVVVGSNICCEIF